MHCFDNNYVIPAGVSIYSMLQNANSDYQYELYVLHSDITSENIKKLTEIVRCFKNASIQFIDLQDKFGDLFENTIIKGHYTKEMFYKFLAPSIFPQLEKIIITDVDVVFLGDISIEFERFNVEDDYLLAAANGDIVGNFLDEFKKETYGKDFSEEEIKKLNYSAGYYIFNLNKMRGDNSYNKFINCAYKNAYRLKQPEQDVISLVCYPKIKTLPLNTVVCTYLWEFYKDEMSFENNLFYSGEEIKMAMKYPLQLHYAGSVKPWNNITSIKSEIWYEYLAKTIFWSEFSDKLVFEKKKYKYKIYIFKVIPVFLVEKIERNWYSVKLFGLFPLLKVKRKNIYLFNFLWVGKIK